MPKVINTLYTPAAWYRTAAVLMAAARTLWPKVRGGFTRPRRPQYPKQLQDLVQHGPAFLLLCAFAAENALKGTKVKQIRRRRGTPIFSTKKKTTHIDGVWGHNLPKLARDIGLVTDNSDDEMLHVLMRNITWAGRYPATEGEGVMFLQRYGSDDLRRVTRLIARIKRL